MNWVWDHSRSRHGSRLVLLALADYGEVSWPSIAALVQKTGLGERAVHTAIADLVKLGELAVERNTGPKGCNYYRITPPTGADSAPPQNLHPAKNAPVQNQQGSESPQVKGQEGAESAPGADSAGVQIPTSKGADSAPGTLKEPPINSPTESSKSCADSAGGLFDPPPAAKPKGKRGRKLATTDDPLFDEWYAAYPLHKARGEAEKAWAEVMTAGADAAVLTAAAKAYQGDRQVLRGFPKFPATWLRAKCWLDEPAPPPDLSAANGHKPTAYSDEEYDRGWQ